MSTQTFSNQMPLKASSEELAQNGVRREAVPQRSGGARRTLCGLATFRRKIPNCRAEASSISEYGI
jgi:hypothetical protein